MTRVWLGGSDTPSWSSDMHWQDSDYIMEVWYECHDRFMTIEVEGLFLGIYRNHPSFIPRDKFQAMKETTKKSRLWTRVRKHLSCASFFQIIDKARTEGVLEGRNQIRKLAQDFLGAVN